MDLFDKISKKYNIAPEDNMLRDVYGMPMPNQKELGKEIEDNNDDKKWGSGLKKLEVDLDRKNKETVSVIVNNFCLSLTKWGNMCDMLFMDKTKEPFIKDSIVSISQEKYEQFINKINNISLAWHNDYTGEKSIKWHLKFSTKEINKIIIGNGEYPDNWNSFIDLISEYEILFKKIITYENTEKKLKSNYALEQLVKEELQDSFWEEKICHYLRNEVGKDEVTLKIIFKKLIKYEDIFNEFKTYLIKKDYDIPGAVSIEGYTAKKIAELNPMLKASGVYTLLNYLREKPGLAKQIIKKDFSDIKQTSTDCYLKLVYTPLHGCYPSNKPRPKVEPIISYHKPELNKTMTLDEMLVIVDELSDKYIKLTIPYKSGMIADRKNYYQQQPTKITLGLNETYTVQLDVLDASETWEISYINNKETNVTNEESTDKELLLY